MMDAHHGKTCNCEHHQMVPALIVLFGLDFFLASLGIFTWGFVSLTWPLLVIFAGLVKMNEGRCKCYQ